MDVHIPTHKEIYMISYLVFKGWELDYCDGVWTKPGLKHEVWDHRQEKYIDSSGFELEDAYWTQKDADEKENSKSSK